MTRVSTRRRVLGNLVSNAIRYTNQGSVVVRATSQADHVRVEIRDTGVGIPEEHRERIFEEFFPVGNPERDRSKGLGLGLAIVRRIVNVLGHSLELESAAGHGSCVALRVPPGNPAEISTAAEPLRVIGDLLRGRTILVIEDEAMVREGTASVLAAWGSSPRLAADAAEAVREARHQAPDLSWACPPSGPLVDLGPFDQHRREAEPRVGLRSNRRAS